MIRVHTVIDPVGQQQAVRLHRNEAFQQHDSQPLAKRPITLAANVPEFHPSAVFGLEIGEISFEFGAFRPKGRGTPIARTQLVVRVELLGQERDGIHRGYHVRRGFGGAPDLELGDGK